MPKQQETFWWFWMRSLRAWLEDGCPAEPGTELDLDLPEPPKHVWAVLTALASFGSTDGSNVRPSYKRVTVITQMPGGHGMRIVRSVVTRAEQAGFLVPAGVHHRNQPGRPPRQFQLAVPDWWQAEMRQRDRARKHTADRGISDRGRSQTPVDEPAISDRMAPELVTARGPRPTDRPTDTGSVSAGPLQGPGASTSPEPRTSRAHAAKLAAVNGEFAGRDLTDPRTAAEYRARLAHVGISA